MRSSEKIKRYKLNLTVHKLNTLTQDLMRLSDYSFITESKLSSVDMGRYNGPMECQPKM